MGGGRSETWIVTTIGGSSVGERGPKTLTGIGKRKGLYVLREKRNFRDIHTS